MLSFQKIYEEVQEQVSDTNATSLVVIKRAINQGMKKFGAILNREWRVTYKTFNIVANQQYYQMPEDAIRIKSVTVLASTGSTKTYTLEEIADEDIWNRLNYSSSNTSSMPTHYFVRGSDEFGIYPEPSAAVTSGGTLGYERRMRDMAQDDYTTGTVTVTAGSTTVTGSGTTFTEAMVGRYLSVTDGSADGMWYKIQSYSSATVITLENTYGGTTGSGRTFSIGEVPDIPEEFHESLIDYACYRYYLRRRNMSEAKDMKAVFDEALGECRANYSSKTSSQYTRVARLNYRQRYNSSRYTVTGS